MKQHRFLFLAFCLITAFMLLLSVAVADDMNSSSGLEMAVSYEDGILTVSAAVDSFYMILIDGHDAGRSLSRNYPTVNISTVLSEGRHSITITSDFLEKTYNANLYVGDEPENPSENNYCPEGYVHKGPFEYRNIVNPTCTNGSRDKYCTVCGRLVVTEPIEGNGHVWDNETIIIEPTYTEAGLKTYTCSVCGVEKNETIPKLIDMALSYEDEVLTVSVAVDGYYGILVDGSETGRALSRNYPTASISTVLSEGRHNITITSDIYGTYQVTFYVGDEPADFSENNYCPEGYIHKGPFEYRNIVNPTCTDGSRDKYCTICGRLVVTEPIKGNGHVWGNETIVKEPTNTETGLKTYTCSVCGEEKNETIPKLIEMAVSYENGILTVIGPGDTYYIVFVDGNEIGKAIGPKYPSVSFAISLAEGKHIITITSDLNGKIYNANLYVGDNPTVEPTVNPSVTLTLPYGLTTIETEAFNGIAAELVVVPDGCRSIAVGAFMNCPNLKEIIVPANCNIAEGACDISVIINRR